VDGTLEWYAGRMDYKTGGEVFRQRTRRYRVQREGILVVVFWVRDAEWNPGQLSFWEEEEGRDGPENPTGEIVLVSFAVLSETDSLRIEAVVEVRWRGRRERFSGAGGRVVARVDRVDRVPHDSSTL
jgi:hypothetical protein